MCVASGPRPARGAQPGKPRPGRGPYAGSFSTPPMADTSYNRRSPFGIALLVVSVLALLFIVFIMSQRGGEANGQVGSGGIDAPEQLEIPE